MRERDRERMRERFTPAEKKSMRETSGRDPTNDIDRRKDRQINFLASSTKILGWTAIC